MRTIRRSGELIEEAVLPIGPKIDPHFIIGAVADVVRMLLSKQAFALFHIKAHIEVRIVRSDQRRGWFACRTLMSDVPWECYRSSALPRTWRRLWIKRRRRIELGDRHGGNCAVGGSASRLDWEQRGDEKKGSNTKQLVRHD